jgi:hypothetical protein
MSKKRIVWKCNECAETEGCYAPCVVILPDWMPDDAPEFCFQSGERQEDWERSEE